MNLLKEMENKRIDLEVTKVIESDWVVLIEDDVEEFVGYVILQLKSRYVNTERS